MAGIKAEHVGMLVGGVIVAAIGSCAIDLFIESDAERQERLAAELDAERVEALRLAECRTDLQCWGDEHMLDANLTCPALIERLARFDYRWTKSNKLYNLLLDKEFLSITSKCSQRFTPRARYWFLAGEAHSVRY